MYWIKRNKIPLLQALGVFFVLVSFVFLVVKFSVNYGLDVEALSFVFALLCCSLASLYIFDRIQISEARSVLKNLSGPEIASDIFPAYGAQGMYAQLYMNSPVPYFIIEHDGLVRSSNIAASRLLGVSKRQVAGINIFDRVNCDQIDHLNMLVYKYQSGVSISDELVRVKRADHRESWALMSLFGLGTDSEQLGLLTLVDITKQKKAEDAKSEFVSLASHQLRTPIAGMKWSAELLLVDNPESLSENQRKYIDRLLVSVRRMALLVDDFLRVSRFELGTFQPEYKTVNVQELFKDILTEQNYHSKQRNLQIKTFYDESVDSIVSDANLLRMVVANLLSNAIKYSYDKGTIHVGYKVKEDKIILSVADNGIGIPFQDQDEVFSKLFRASNAVRDVPDGTGLGLYIVREAVAVLDGSVSFTSTEKMGATFEVMLPLNLPLNMN